MAKQKRTKSPHRGRVWAWRIFLTLGLLIGLALVFNEPIKLWVVDLLGNRASQHLDADTIKQNEKVKGSFDFDAVNALDLTTVGKAAGANLKPIGMIAVPSVKMKLPIFKGLANSNLSAGAGTMKPDQKMGEGNYALAGHYMTNKGILFSPLKGVTRGDNVYITDLTKVYTYKVTSKAVIYESHVEVIDDVPGKKLITLITCASATEGETNRIFIRGALTSAKPITAQTEKLFK
ncbi:class A sortase [Lacticaseibacillus nasuensis]|uniref:class A sortase n=1 Tax=Lacticaseibacillus nasuensis TaxID=944671 RepID=UPI002245D767|nr:class A sortase [Lacticaseibacillus nasuensis]MCX2454930.1 class A sortase [Lacticaseibacillus nasuensis]